MTQYSKASPFGGGGSASTTGAGDMPTATYIDNAGGTTVTGTSYTKVVIATSEIEDTGFSNTAGVVTIPTTGRYSLVEHILYLAVLDNRLLPRQHFVRP